MRADDDDFHPTTRFGTLSGRGVLAALLGSFAIVFAVNGLLIYNALSTFDGIEVPDAYKRGRAYNHVLDAMEAQKALGWRTAIEVDDKGRGHEVRLAVNFTNRDGAPLRDLKILATFWRPVVDGVDQGKAMVEAAPGRYEADFRLAYGGNWIVRVAAEGPAGEKFAQEERFNIHD
ncbi:MAG: FixH family protein [Parvibaculum sp.]|nr:FixH family protein [Parvibaculum sp.]